MARPTPEQVRALAPDVAGLKAGTALAHPRPWSELGHAERAVWGTCRGSAKEPYRVVCDLHGPAYRCSCPSRKFPCKHAIGLLLLWSAWPQLVPEMPPTPEAAAWLAGRDARRAGASDDAPLPPAPGASDGAPLPPAPGGRGDDAEDAATTSRRAADPAAAAARAAQRSARIIDGMNQLERWLEDLLREGLGPAAARPFSFWSEMAARLVDAQAPGAAARVRALGGLPRSGGRWPERMLSQVARLHLLASGWNRWDDLPEDYRATLRTAAGWPWPSDTVLAGDRTRDKWYVLARSETEEERFTTVRTWLWGEESHRPALVLDFNRPGEAPAWELWPGHRLDAEVAWFPGSAPMRVLVAQRFGEADESPAPPPGWTDLAQVVDARHRALVADPWLERWPVSVASVVPRRPGDRWSVTDRSGAEVSLSMADDAGWKLLAISGGQPVHLLGEWEEDSIRPLGAWNGERMVVL
jgi:hypothetical protein